MTEKQENILNAALKRFAEHGYAATSTSKIASDAGVSEGLIFRHFKNKDGLLEAIAKLGEEKFKALYANVVDETNPIEIIRNAVLIPLNVPPEDYDFWRLQYKLKWEIKDFNKDKTTTFRDILITAFTDLDYDEPEAEADIILVMIDGIGSGILKGHLENVEALTNLVLKKYHII